MKNLLRLFLVGLIITSCSQEDIQLDESSQSDLLLKSKSTDLATIATFKGTYVATGTQIRGHVLVMISKNNSRASITLADNTELKFTSVTPFTSNSTSRSLLFESEAGTFSFTTNADGNNPIISDLTILGMNGNIIVAKETAERSVHTMTGTFGCGNCGGHPILSSPEYTDTFVWNMIFEGPIGETGTVTTQVTYGSSVIVGTGDRAAASFGENGMWYSDLNGAYDYSATAVVSWTSELMRSGDKSCESMAGTWNFLSPRHNIDGWLRSDSVCDVNQDDEDDPDYTYCNEAQTKALICHGGNTLCVSVNAIAAHLAHGDVLGSCDD